MSSLIFSEDFGPTSILNSPAISGFRDRDRDRDRTDRGGGRSDGRYKDEQIAYSDNNNHQQQLYKQQSHLQQQQHSEDMRSNEYKNNTSEFHSQPRDPVTEENERLKSVIREVSK